MSEDTMVSSPSSTTPTSTTIDLPSPSTGKEPSTTTSPSSSTSIKDTVIALDKMLRCVSREVYALGYQLNKSFQSDELSGVIDIVAERTNMFMYDSKLFSFFRSCISYILVPQFPTTGYQLEAMSLEELQNFPLVSLAWASFSRISSRRTI